MDEMQNKSKLSESSCDMSEHESTDSGSMEDVFVFKPIKPTSVPRPRSEQLLDYHSGQTEKDFYSITIPLTRGKENVPIFLTNGGIKPANSKRNIFMNDVCEDGKIKFPPIIRLNVGGVKYMTRLSTLIKYSDSMLAAMFSGRHPVDKDDEEHYFLDSCGILFGFILEFLRNASLPPNDVAVAVYKEANYYGLHELSRMLQLKPELACLFVKESHRAQFPNYNQVRDQVIKMAIEHGAATKIGEVIIYAFRTEFIPKTQTFNPNHGCVVDSSHIQVGPWSAPVDEEIFMKCLESDLLEEGFSVRPHDVKRKCRYYHGQTCQKFVYKLQILF